MRCHDWRIGTHDRLCLLLGEDHFDQPFKTKASLDLSPDAARELAKALEKEADAVEIIERLNLQDVDGDKARL